MTADSPRLHWMPRAGAALDQGVPSRLVARLYLFGIIVVCSACGTAAVPRAPDTASGEEIKRLRADNAALPQRLDDGEAERDRLREKAEVAAPTAAEAHLAPESDPASERPPATPGLPIVKLAPSPKSSGSEGVEVEAEAPRPVLRAYGEDEGTVTSGGFDDQPPARKKSSVRPSAHL